MRGIAARPSILAAIGLAMPLTCAAPARAQAVIRGLYTPGMTATNSGVLPEAGLTYQGLFQLYSFDQNKGPEGETIPVSLSSSVVADQNIFLWVTERKVWGGKYAVMADL